MHNPLNAVREIVAAAWKVFPPENLCSCEIILKASDILRSAEHRKSHKSCNMVETRAGKWSKSVWSIMSPNLYRSKNTKFLSWYCHLNRTNPDGVLKLVVARHPCPTLFVSILSRPILARSRALARSIRPPLLWSNKLVWYFGAAWSPQAPLKPSKR